jgi:hypothetical protein
VLRRVEDDPPDARLELEVERLAEETAHGGLVAPARRIRLLRPDADAFVDLPELRAPAPPGQPEPAAEPADARELTCDGFVVGGEDRSEARRDDVEARIRVGKRLRVALVPANRQTVGLCARLLEQRRRDVDADDLRARTSRANGDRARSGRDVEPALPRPRLEPRDDLLVDRRQPLGEERVLAARPDV